MLALIRKIDALIIHRWPWLGPKTNDNLSDLDRYHAFQPYIPAVTDEVFENRVVLNDSDNPIISAPARQHQADKEQPVVKIPYNLSSLNLLLRKIGKIYAGKSAMVPPDIQAFRKARKLLYNPHRMDNFHKVVSCDSGYEQRIAEDIDRGDTYITAWDSQTIRLLGYEYGHKLEYWPDFLLRTADQATILLEVKNDQNILEDRFFLKAQMCRKRCIQLKWGYVVTIPGMRQMEELLQLELPAGILEYFNKRLKARTIYHQNDFGITQWSVDQIRKIYNLSDEQLLAACLQLGIATRKSTIGKTYYGLLSPNQSWRDVLIGYR